MLAERLSILTKPSQTADRRQSYRIAPPSSLVKELAIWFQGECADRTLPLEELGYPHVLSINGSNEIYIVNISSLGMRLAIPRHRLPPVHQIKQGHCYVYLKLRSPIPGKCNVYCIMLGLTLLGVSESDGLIHFRGKFSSRGMAAHSSKSFLLFNVERFGIKEISVWCKEIARMGRGLLPPISVGLDIEYVLTEVSLLKNQSFRPAAATEKTTRPSLPDQHVQPNTPFQLHQNMPEEMKTDEEEI